MVRIQSKRETDAGLLGMTFGGGWGGWNKEVPPPPTSFWVWRRASIFLGMVASEEQVEHECRRSWNHVLSSKPRLVCE